MGTGRASWYLHLVVCPDLLRGTECLQREWNDVLAVMRDDHLRQTVHENTARGARLDLASRGLRGTPARKDRASPGCTLSTYRISRETVDSELPLGEAARPHPRSCSWT